MTDQRIQYGERLVGAGHPTLADTINRHALVEHNSDGTHKYGGKLFAYQHTPVSHTGNTTETVLASFTIPGGTMGPNGTLDYMAIFGFSGGANTKTIRARLGGIGGTVIWTYGIGSTVLSSGTRRTLSNRNSESSQIARGPGSVIEGSSTTANATFAVNTAVDQTLVFTGQLVNSADTVSLEDAFVMVFR